MIRLLLFDAMTGKIKGRIVTPENIVDQLGPHLLIGENLTEEEWELRPEMFFKVDVESKQLIDLDDSELMSTHGLKAGAVLPQRPDAKARGR